MAADLELYSQTGAEINISQSLSVFFHALDHTSASPWAVMSVLLMRPNAWWDLLDPNSNYSCKEMLLYRHKGRLCLCFLIVFILKKKEKKAGTWCKVFSGIGKYENIKRECWKYVHFRFCSFLVSFVSFHLFFFSLLGLFLYFEMKNYWVWNVQPEKVIIFFYIKKLQESCNLCEKGECMSLATTVMIITKTNTTRTESKTLNAAYSSALKSSQIKKKFLTTIISLTRW